MNRDFIDQIVDTIQGALPFRVICPLCKKEIEPDLPLHIEAAQKEWRKIAGIIVAMVQDEIADKAGEAIGKIKL